MEQINNVKKEGVLDNRNGELLEPDSFDEKTSESYGSQLCEYLTGLKISDPTIVERLQKDQQILRTKYSLPSFEKLKFAPSEFEEDLRVLARLYNVDIREKKDFESFFEEHPYARGVHFEGDKVVSLDLERNRDLVDYKRTLTVLEHELIHAMQVEHSPGMPIELMEYEAYVVNANFSNLEGLKEDEVKEVVETFFGFLIGGSVSHHYRERSKIQGEEVREPWYKEEIK